MHTKGDNYSGYSPIVVPLIVWDSPNVFGYPLRIIIAMALF